MSLELNINMVIAFYKYKTFYRCNLISLSESASLVKTDREGKECLEADLY
jgi:hypothetical protein